MNARDEFIEFFEGKPPLKCAWIMLDASETKEIGLSVNFTDEELNDFLDSINFRYDDGYGGQELYGRIWFTDGTWADRGEYDGSEWWEYHKCPDIPSDLKR
jgi:hypothetical protein